MKEKIIKILESQFSVVEYEDPDTGFTESTTIDVLTTDEFPDIVDKLEILVNQEVEKRIAGVMPTKNEIGNAAQLFDKQKRPLWKEAIWRAGANWAIDIIRSRLSQKTDNLKENNNNGSTN